jgi:hypothetical protein
MLSMRFRRHTSGERGQVFVLFALMLPLFFALSGFVIGIGNWYIHAKHLQTKADAGALAGGGLWGFPCGTPGSAVDQRIQAAARLYSGANNPQVGGVPSSSIHTVLNGPDWYDDDSNPLPTENLAICDAEHLDVKVTEDNSFPLASLIPLFPDIKRKARVEIEQVEAATDLLPIGVRVPKPQSAAAVFYDEQTGVILDAKNFCEMPAGLPVSGLPSGLGGWTTLDPGNPLCASWAHVNVGVKTGVVVATSVRPACGTGNPPAAQPCLNTSGWTGQQVNAFCRQASGTVQCFDANGLGSTQSVQSGIQFIRGYDASPNNGTGPPVLKSVYLDSATPAGCGAYFSSLPRTCTIRLTAQIDLGNLQGTYPNTPPPGTHTEPLKASDVEVRYMAGRTDGTAVCDYGTACDLTPASPNSTGIVSFSTTFNVPQESQNTAVAIRIGVRNTTNLSSGNCASFGANCRWYWNGNGIVAQNQISTAAQIVATPVQRTYSGSTSLTGPIKWTRLTADTNCDQTPDLGITETLDAASVPGGQNCFYMEVGLQGALALDQDEPPFALNLGDTSSQRAFIDCDPAASSNLADEIQNGCPARYARHQFTPSYGGNWCPNVSSPQALLDPHPAPWDSTNGWPPTRCVITAQGQGNQVIRGLNQRLFNVQNNPSCPADDRMFASGRNYWHDANNAFIGTGGITDLYTFAQDNPAPARGSRLRLDDPRLVTLFFTPYDSFSNTGSEVFPITGFGAFYVTGYGRTTAGGGAWQGGRPEDPCTGGNSGDPLDGMPLGVGNEPPPDLNLGKNQTWVWGHWVTPVFLTSNATGSGDPCDQAQFQPCVAVLVE